MKPEEKSRLTIDKKLIESGWVIQDVKSLNLSASLGIAVREFPTSTGPVDYRPMRKIHSCELGQKKS